MAMHVINNMRNHHLCVLAAADAAFTGEDYPSVHDPSNQPYRVTISISAGSGYASIAAAAAFGLYKH